jgi:hypothetical protein
MTKNNSKNPITFEQIDAEIEELRRSDFEAQALRVGKGDPLVRLVKFYRPMRLILAVVANLPLIDPTWRGVIKMFVITMDGIAFTTDPSFKAGKDL